MSVFVRTLLAGEQPSNEEETFGPLETLEIRQEGLVVTHDVDVAVDRYEAIVESAASLESLATLANDHPTSLESLAVPFDVASAGHLKGDLSLEGISSFLKKVWDTVVKAWNKVKEMVMKLINWITGRGGKSQKDAVKDAQRSLDKDDKIEVDSDPKETKEVADKFTKSLAKREKELNDATRKVLSSSGVDELIDGIPTGDFEEFNAFMSEDTSKKSAEVSAKDHAKELEASIDATEDAAKQYEKTIKARDDLQKAIDKSVSKLDVKDENSMASAFRKLQSGPEVKAGKVLNFTAKKNAKDVKKISKRKDVVKERQELEKGKVAGAFVTRNSDIALKLKKSNKVLDAETNSNITVDKVVRLRTKSATGKILEYLAPYPKEGYRGAIRPFDVAHNNEVFVKEGEVSGIPHIDTENKSVEEALNEIPNYMETIPVSKLRI